MVQLDISKLKNSPGEVRRLEMDFRLEPVEIETGLIFFNASLRLDANLANDGGVLKLQGFVEGEVSIACGRCLDLFNLPVRADLEEVYYNQSQQEVGPGEEWISFRGDVLDVTPEVVKVIIASLPMKALCREDCRGLCQGCGANLNHGDCGCSLDDVDPRMEALKRLLEKDKG